MLVRWNPFREMQTFEDRMERMFSEFFRKNWPSDLPSTTWAPAVDVVDSDEGIMVKAELPGIKKEDIQLEIMDNTLHLKGERKQEKEEKGNNYYINEINCGSFHRAFTLPAAVDMEKVKAEYKDGVLEIVLPKKEEAKIRKISISN